MISYRHDIDGLRCLAVLLVVLFHIQLWPLSGGYIGVDVFFVISGFLVTSVITHAMEKGTFKFTTFYARRIRRLFPAIFVTVVLSFFGGWILLPPDIFSDFAQSSIATMLSGSNFYFWATSGYFETAAHYKPLLHTWSLAIEEQFYLIWPLTIFLIVGTAIKRNRLSIVLLSFVILSTLLAEWAIRANYMTAAFFLLPFRMNEFAIGALVAFLPAWKNRPGYNVIAVAGLAGLIVPAILYTPETIFPGINAMIPCLATAGLIYAGRETIMAKVLSNPVMTYIGRMSYSLYLAHWPIIAFYFLWRGSASGLEPVEQIGLIAASFGIGALMYHFVEVPFRLSRGTAKIAPKLDNNGVGLWFTASTLAVVLVSAFVWGKQGVPSRYNDNSEIAKLVDSMAPEDPKKLRLARMNARGKRSLLLIGDSHAAVVRLAALEWARGNNFKIVDDAIGGCVPLLDVQTSLGRDSNGALCEERNMDVFPAEGFGQYDLVLMISRWGLYTGHSTQIGSRNGRLVRPMLMAGETKPNRDVEFNRARFTEQLQKTADRINADGSAVLFVGQVPHIGDNPLSCVSGSDTVQEVEAKCNRVSREETLSESLWATKAARKIKGLTVYDPTPLFCDETNCIITKDGHMLYQDADHLSLFGADYLLENLGEALLDAVVNKKN